MKSRSAGASEAQPLALVLAPLVPHVEPEVFLERFAAGEFAYSIAGDWDYRGLQEKMGDKLGVAVMPSIDISRASRSRFRNAVVNASRA